MKVRNSTGVRGIRERSNGKFQAYFSLSIGGKSLYKVVGTYPSIKEATDNRNKFIDSLK